MDLVFGNNSLFFFFFMIVRYSKVNLDKVI